MTISEPRFAAAYRLPDGSVRKFDDLGDLLAYGRRAGERPSGAVWVHDYATDGWVAAAEAWFVRVPGLTSPMGHGIAAFAGEGAAADFARARGGRVRRWPDLQDSSGAPTTGQ